jgi:predicted  nucleic acid-binding Zn-ribbon protein
MRRTFRNGPIDVDQIVANYTALGRAQRRKTGKRRLLRLGIAGSAIAAAALVWWSGLATRLLDASSDLDARSDAVSDLRAIVESELEQLTAARAELATERDRYAAKSGELETELAAFADRHAALEAQQADLTAQSAELRAALAKVDSERAALVAATAPNPALERELVAIGEERRALEERWKSFSDQGRQLSTELEALEQQRSALEAERAGMERQRRDLESLLDAAAAGPSASADALETSPAPDAGLDPLFASAVDATDLGEMRGGVLLGNGMNIAIGLTRTATINGEEQYASALRIDDLTAGLDPAALDAMRPLVIQNGTGNAIAPGLLDDWSAGFGTIIQNSRDNQAISTSTIYDVQVQDVGQAIRDMAGSQAVTDSLSFHH